MTMQESVNVIVKPKFIDKIENIRREAQRGPLHRGQLKIVKTLAKQGFSGARQAFEQCSRAGLKERKRFMDIVKETPRLEGETEFAWARRVLEKCDKYETNIPSVITIEHLERLSR